MRKVIFVFKDLVVVTGYLFLIKVALDYWFYQLAQLFELANMVAYLKHQEVILLRAVVFGFTNKSGSYLFLNTILKQVWILVRISWGMSLNSAFISFACVYLIGQWISFSWEIQDRIEALVLLGKCQKQIDQVGKQLEVKSFEFFTTDAFHILEDGMFFIF